jgi:hypothetical protein
MRIKFIEADRTNLVGVEQVPVGRFFTHGWNEDATSPHIYLRINLGALRLDERLSSFPLDNGHFTPNHVRMLPENFVVWLGGVGL